MIFLTDSDPQDMSFLHETTDRELTSHQWEQCGQYVGAYLEATLAEQEKLEANADTTYQEHGTLPTTHPDRDVLETQYWQMRERIGELATFAETLFELAGEIEAGEADPRRIIELLGIEKANSDTEQPRRRQRPQYESEMTLGHLLGLVSTDEIIQGPTDSTRYATGRNRTRLVTSGRGRITESDAQDEFDYVTTDTHGGKVRRPSKGATHYSKNGRRIRKR